MNTAPGTALTDPAWVRAHITALGRSWGASTPRAAGTLWWSMVASALVEPLVTATAAGRTPPALGLGRLVCVVRPDGGVDRVLDPAATPETAPPPVGARTGVVSGGGASAGDAATDTASPGGAPAAPDDATTALHDALAAVVPVVADSCGAGIPALWAIVADALGNRAVDAGAPAVAVELAARLGPPLPTPRFVEVGGRTFVHRVSCCLVYELPGSGLCTSCPKRPAAERAALLAEHAARR
ncbi:Uncharacterized Fe-S protein [Nocardia farcinica]|uniref:Uncharacterized Fe-S protein n=1 Tax=Nocardia farcinica TaxID=37329 RepID=A0A449H0X3_NOCFR|nr:(2Fe-2S)-binding protein [Nocardia farcinica]VFA91540.1 Uncharacterized Fe-S protein [Nocardia farcinica]